MGTHLRSPAAFLRYWRRSHPNDPIILLISAAVIGVLVGYAAIGFRLALDFVQVLGFGFGGENVFSQAAQLEWWHVVAVPTVGGLLVGVFVRYVMPGRRPQGVADVIEAVALKGGRMSLRQGISAAFVNIVSLGVGSSTGREGPIVHVGATLASFAAQKLHVSPSMRLTLLGCGVAAGVAASFNAPIAGVFFALEVVIGHYALHAFAPVVLASVVGTIVSRIQFGDTPAFIIPDYAIVSFLEFPAFLILGGVCGVIAMIFMWSAMFADDVVTKLRIPDALRPASGGLAIGIIAVFFPQILGVGYEATDAALNEQFALWLLIVLITAKTAATAICLGCRFGGGVFSPSIMLGAMTGGAYGIIAAYVFPEMAASHGLYAIVGMGAMAAAVLGAPISTILIVFELTGDYKITIAVMVAAVVSTFLSQSVVGKSFFHWQLQRRNINVRGGRAQHFLRERRVSDVMSFDYETVPQHAGIEQMKALLLTSSHSAFFVVDEEKRLVGTLTFGDLKAAVRESGDDSASAVTAFDVCHRDPPALVAPQTLEDALALLDSSREEHLAVVQNRREMRIIGVVHQKDALVAHNRALLQAHAEEHDER